MGVISRRLMWVEYVGVVSRRWMWVESTGEGSGCGCKEVYRFFILLIPTPPVYVLFLQLHPCFLFIFLMFFVLVPVLFCN